MSELNHHPRHHHHADGNHRHPSVGHNLTHDDHLHSHVHGSDEQDHEEELKTLAAAFVDGFRSADDKSSYLRIAGVPFSRTGPDGLTMHLVDVAIASNWQVGTASPAFASRELVYLPYPGAMITERETMTFTYVSLTERYDLDLSDFLHETHQHASG